MANGTYVLKEKHLKILNEIYEKSGLKKSEIVRQAIEMFYEKWKKLGAK